MDKFCGLGVAKRGGVGFDFGKFKIREGDFKMMKTLMLTTALVAASFAAQAQATSTDVKTVVPGTYELDVTHASVEWKVMHMGFSHFAGRFEDMKGTATVGSDLTKSGVVITIDADSAETGVDKLDDHLETADFFDAKKYPAITFTSTKIEVTGKTADGKPTGKVHGMLSMRGVTKPIVLTATFNGHGQHVMSKVETLGFNATGVIKRSEFGMTYGAGMVGDEVTLDIAAEFSKK